MIQKFTVSRDDTIYQAWPDLALTKSGKLVCVFSECTHHGDRSYTRIMMAESTDRGRTWSSKRPVTVPGKLGGPTGFYWNCARITALKDGRLAVVVDKIRSRDENDTAPDSRTNWLILSEDEGKTWSEPIKTPVTGIVPDKLLELKHGGNKGRWLLSAHMANKTVNPQEWKQNVWISDDKGASWQGPFVAGYEPGLMLCEGSILEMPEGQLVCFMRENSFRGLDCYKTISLDGGKTWSSVIQMPIPGCHRPVAGILQSGKVLITHRFLQGGKGWLGKWTQNFFAAWTDVESCLSTERSGAWTRIMPIDYDRSPEADTGYSGWVQFPDGEIYVVNYIVDDAPKAQIRGYSFYESDIILPQKK